MSWKDYGGVAAAGQLAAKGAGPPGAAKREVPADRRTPSQQPGRALTIGAFTGCW